MKRSSKAKLLLLGLGGAASPIVAPQTAVAYQIFGGSCHFNLFNWQVKYKNQTGGSGYWWTDGALPGASKWNLTTHDGPYLTSVTSGAFDVSVKTFNSSGSPTGYFNENRSAQGGGVTCSDGNSSWSDATIWLNTSVGATWVTNKRTAVGVHEWGHAFGMKDLPQSGCGTKDSMMQGGIYSYDNCGWVAPRSDDVNGVAFY
jgi:hypothetical protein